ncbi:MJ1244 family protein [Methanocaldococcus indicus]|uniref:MJ1244 family protein n=1 Tax=Methanocaldococcus indicus TaxID=213231 RepID=UPI003C6D9A1C
MKVLVYVFVEIENVGKAINALSEAEITGFFLYEYKGMSPQDWKGFLIDEAPEAAVNAIKNLAKNAVVIGTVVSEEKFLKIKKYINEKLSNEKYTIIAVPVVDIKVNVV